MIARRHPALLALLALGLAALLPGPTPQSSATRIEALPFVIEQPGRYVLAGDLTGPDGVAAITVTTSGVVLDLGGHRLEGGEGSLAGIQGARGIERVELRHGVVALFGGDGIALGGCLDARLENLRVLDNGGHGVVLGARARLVDCESLFNHGGRAYVLGDDASLRGCRAAGAEYGGFYAGARAVLDECSASKSVYGAGMQLGPRAIVRGGSVSENGGAGLRVGRRSFVTGIVSEDNVAVGIEAGAASVLVECTVRNTLDGDGMVAGKDCALRGCRSGRNEGDGYAAAEGVELRACVAIENRGHGFSAGSGAALRDNTAEANRGDGIHVAGRGALLRGNRGLRNARADLHVEGSGHQIFANRARAGRYEVPEGQRGINAVGPWLPAAEARGDPLANLVED